MSFWQPVSNLRQYVSHNPPGATFFLCLLTLAISFIYLSSYSYTHSVPNPDITKDWNIVLSSLTQFHLCEKINSSSTEQVPSHSPPVTEQEKTKTTSDNLSESPSSVTVLNLHVPMAVSTSSSQSGSLKNIGLVSSLPASQLNLGGKEMVNFTLWIISVNSCLTISAPTNILPATPKLPLKCHPSEKNTSIIPVEVTNQLDTSQTCYKLHFKNDPTLRVMLTLKDKSVAVRHLLEVSLVLLAVCLLLCLAASLTRSNTRHKQYSGLDLQNETLIDS